jgi:hypothetical protein
MLDVKQLLGDLVQSVKQGEFNSTAMHLTTLLEQKPELLEDWLGISKLALLVGEVNLAKESLKLFKKRAKSKLNIDMAYLAALVDVGEFVSAITKAELLFKDNNKSAEISHFLSTAYLQIGESKKAAEFAKLTLAIWPLSGEAWLVLANADEIELNSELFNKMSGLEKQLLDTANNRSKASYLAALSKIYESNGELTQAFKYANKSNSNMDIKVIYDFATEQKYISNIINYAPFDKGALTSNILTDSQNPIFIIGLPRSGTTLLEQILCSHSHVIDGGEFNGMERASRRITVGLPMGESAEQFDITTTDIEGIRNQYLKYAHQKFGADGAIVDKSLNNSRYVWLIKKVFPVSPIIFMQRNPVDTAWSCYKTHFSQGLKWTTELTTIAHYFNCESTLFKYWQNKLSNTFLVVKYEDLIKNTESEINRIVDYCKLSFEVDMLDFFNTKRVIYTASTVQARKELYLSSISSGELDEFLGEFLDNYQDN